MKLSTGKIAFPIEFDNGDKDIIYINPNDPKLYARLMTLTKTVTSRIGEMGDIKLDNSGKPLEAKDIENFTKVENIIMEELDTAFGSEISYVIFKHCSPFAIVNGEYYIIQFMEAIRPELEKEIKKANKEAEKRLSKHLDKYSK